MTEVPIYYETNIERELVMTVQIGERIWQARIIDGQFQELGESYYKEVKRRFLHNVALDYAEPIMDLL